MPKQSRDTHGVLLIRIIGVGIRKICFVGLPSVLSTARWSSWQYTLRGADLIGRGFVANLLWVSFIPFTYIHRFKEVERNHLA